jgi:hypothetical protein
MRHPATDLRAVRARARRCGAAVAAALLACAGAAAAHDTWFSPQPEFRFVLATGSRFPAAELAVDDKYFVKHGCRGNDGAAVALQTLRYAESGTWLRARPAGRASLSCFMQLEAFDIELPPDKIEVYFNEIRPSAAVLAAWSAMSARGLPFREHYTKSARIDVGPGAPRQLVGMAMDVLRLSPADALEVGVEAEFQVLRDGRPLADLPIELLNERSPDGLWQRTDAQGRIRVRLPLPGLWLMRGVDLHVTGDATRFESWFIAYTFEVVR